MKGEKEEEEEEEECLGLYIIAYSRIRAFELD